MKYSRDDPSSKYKQLIEEYKLMHKKGYVQSNKLQKNPENCYEGKSTIWFVEIINNIIKKNECKNLLDYGSGKGNFYENNFILNNKKYSGFKDHWGIDEYYLYDPCYKKNSILPSKKYDCSICIDVLEHIPSLDLSWVIREIMKYTNKITFFNIACFPAFAILHNGENAHITVKDPRWWHGFFSSIMVEFPKNKIICYCTLKDKYGKRKYYAFSINDNFKIYDKVNFK